MEGGENTVGFDIVGSSIDRRAPSSLQISSRRNVTIGRIPQRSLPQNHPTPRVRCCLFKCKRGMELSIELVFLGQARVVMGTSGWTPAAQGQPWTIPAGSDCDALMLLALFPFLVLMSVLKTLLFQSFGGFTAFVYFW